ncbi:MAG: hypothetical protein WBN94_10320 [Methanothrix sp.]
MNRMSSVRCAGLASFRAIGSAWAAIRDRGLVLGMGRPHARGAGLRKTAALAVSLVSVARWLGAAGAAGMRPGRRGWQESGRAGMAGTPLAGDPSGRQEASLATALRLSGDHGGYWAQGKRAYPRMRPYRRPEK